MKKVSILFLIITICLVILGAIYGKTAKQYSGIKVYSGAEINGKVQITDSGVVAQNKEKMNYFDGNSKFFYVIAGITGIITVVTFIIGKKRRVSSILKERVIIWNASWQIKSTGTVVY